jgi:SAM-dependent methyltransferase
MDVAGEKNTLRFYKSKMPFKAKQFNRIFPLDPYFGEMIGDKKEVWIADVGAGMFSTTGSTWPNVIVHMYPSDYLADEYMGVLRDAGIKPVFPIEKQSMESLTYPDEFFDIVVCINALDHCAKPLDALKEMYRVCKQGGWIYLRHQENNGDYQNFKGMHHWNLCKEGVDFRIWDKESSDTIYGFTSTIQEDKKLKYIVSKLHK